MQQSTDTLSCTPNKCSLGGHSCRICCLQDLRTVAEDLGELEELEELEEERALVTSVDALGIFLGHTEQLQPW